MRLKSNTVVAATALLACLALLEVPADAGCCRVKVRVRVKVHAGSKPAAVITKPVESVVKVAEQATKVVVETQENVIREGSRGVTNVVRAAADAGTDTRKTVAKAATDSLREGDKGWVNITDAGRAAGRYANRYVNDTTERLADAEERLREGKLADSLWHLAVDPVKDTESRAFKLTQESKLANAVGQVAAGAYGGPAGSAAYASWYTYRTTGDAELAIKVGVISGATAWAMKGVAPESPTMAEASDAARAAASSTLPSASVPEAVKRALIAGAIGGAAVSAAGGDAEAVRDGFIRGGAMMLIQDGYRAFTKQQGFYVEGAERPGFCTASVAVVGPPPPCAPRPEWFKRDASGAVIREGGIPVLDYGKVPPDTSFVGLPGSAGNQGWLSQLPAENGQLLTTFAKIPGMNAMAIFHDQWVLSWNMESILLKAPTIIPAIALTYMGTEAPIQQLIADSAIDSIDKNSRVTEHSYIAYKGNVSRRIFVSKGEAPTDIACVVVYQKDGELQDDLAPWYALKDRDYCFDKADGLAAKLAEDGWTVLVR